MQYCAPAICVSRFFPHKNGHRMPERQARGFNAMEKRNYLQFMRSMGVLMILCGSLGLCLFICELNTLLFRLGDQFLSGAQYYRAEYISVATVAGIAYILGCAGSIFQLTAGTVHLLSTGRMRRIGMPLVFTCIGTLFTLICTALLILAGFPFIFILLILIIGLLVPIFFLVSFYFVCRYAHAGTVYACAMPDKEDLAE